MSTGHGVDAPSNPSAQLSAAVVRNVSIYTCCRLALYQRVSPGSLFMHIVEAIFDP